MAGWQEFTGLNRGYVLELYEKYRQDPASVDRRDARALRALDPSAGAVAGRRGHPVPDDRRRRESRAVDPALRSPGGQARSARPARAGRRSVAASRDEQRHRGRSPPPPGDPDFLAGLRDRLEHARGDRSAAPHLLLDHRLRLRARVRAGRAALAAQRGRRRPVPRAGGSDQSRRPARAAHAGRSLRTLPAARVSRQDPLLDRGAATCSCRFSTR